MRESRREGGKKEGFLCQALIEFGQLPIEGVVTSDEIYP